MQAVEEKMAMLKGRYDSSVKMKATIESEIGATKVKLERAEKLEGGLSSEYVRCKFSPFDLFLFILFCRFKLSSMRQML